jgi:hypothetical protein
MTHTASSKGNTVLPPPPQWVEKDDEIIYERFMRHLRNVPTSRAEIKVLSAIQFTADFLGHSDAHIAKTLVDFGLRAPRMAFPADFLKFADQALMRSGWEIGGPSPALKELKEWWNKNGEDPFIAFQGQFDLIEARILI